MSQPKGGLGRGLSALLPKDRSAEPSAGAPAGAELRLIPLEQIKPNARQPRQVIENASLAELAASIRAVGLLQPVIVRAVGEGSYELVAGERRWRASKLAGLEEVPAIVRDAADDSMLRDALIENLQRVDLNPLEEAAAYKQLVDDLGATHEEVADKVGKSRAAITNSLRLLNLSPDVQTRIASGQISAAHGRALAAMANHDAQGRAATRIVAEGLNVRQTEELVRSMAAQGVELTDRAGARESTRTKASERSAGVLEAEAQLADTLATRVSVEPGRKGKGRIVIEYADEEDLERILQVIVGRK